MHPLPARRHWLATCLALGALACGALRAERLPLRVFTTADGLPSNRVNGVYQDRRGFVWVITASGISRFDGQRFLTFGVGSGLPSSSVWQVAETSDGGLWFGTNAGLAHLRAEVLGSERLFDVSHFSGDAADDAVSGLLAEGERLWVGTRAGLWRSSATARWRFERVPLPPGWGERFVAPQLVDGEGSLWLTTERGIGRLLPDGRKVFYPLGRETVAGDATAFLDERGRLWVFSSLGTLVWIPEPAAAAAAPAAPLFETAAAAAERVLPGERVELPRARGESRRLGDAGHLAPFLLARKGLVLFEAEDGITALENGVLRSWVHGGALAGGKWQPLLEDRAGNLWAISAGRGLARIRRAGFVTYGRDDGLPSEDVRAVLEDRDGEIVAITGGAHRSLALFDGARFVDVTPPAFAAILATSRDGQVAAQSADGDWWFTTWEGLLRLRACRARDLARTAPVAVYSEPQGFGSPHMLHLLHARDGRLWLSSWGAPTAAAHVDPATARAEQPPDLHGLAAAQSFAEDRAGDLWASLLQLQGVIHRRGTTLRRFTPGDGLPAGTTSAVFVDSRDRVWIGTGGAGIVRLDDAESERPRLVRFTTTDGLASDAVFCFAEDRRGRIYAGGENGVDRLQPGSWRIDNFTDNEGFLGAGVRGCLSDRKGRLWFTTANGLTRFDPDGETAPRAPEAWMSAVRAAGVVQPGPALGAPALGPLHLGPSPGTVQLDFLGIAPEGRGTVRFEYRLEPNDGAWSGPTAAHSVLYGGLAPGAYRFLVRAIGGEGLTSAVPATVELEILAPLWRRPWFVALMAVALLALAYAAVRLRVRQLVALERVRTRIAADLHDELGATLSTISILSEVGRRRLAEDPAQAAAPLVQIGDHARELMEATSDIVWALDARRDDLDSVLARLRRFALDLLEPRGIAPDFVVPARAAEVPLSAEQKRELYLFCKEALHNVAKHSRARNVRVEVNVTGSALVAEVVDDGVGFDRAALSPAASRDGGHGLPSLEERARRLGGRLRIDSAPGSGTRLRLELKL